MRKVLAASVLPLVLALPFVVGACGGGEEEEGAATAGADGGVETIELSATDFEFEPMEIRLDAAGTYRFVLTNDGDAPHALKIEGNGIEAETETIEGGATGELEVALTGGEYEIYCPVGNHADMGMVGRILVSEGAAGATTDDTMTETETETEPTSGYGY